MQRKMRDLARLTIWRYRPGIIGVTGTVGKTSTKLAIKAVLGKSRRVRARRGQLEQRRSECRSRFSVIGRRDDLKFVSRAHAAGNGTCTEIIFLASCHLRVALADRLQR
jgi:hypothetical protein